MNSAGKDALQIVVKSDTIMKALRLLFDDAAKAMLPDTFDVDNEIIGQRYRAYRQAEQIIETAFENLKGLEDVSSNGRSGDNHI